MRFRSRSWLASATQEEQIAHIAELLDELDKNNRTILGLLRSLPDEWSDDRSLPELSPHDLPEISASRGTSLAPLTIAGLVGYLVGRRS